MAFYGYNDTDLRSGCYHVRTLLEIALHALRREARCELSAVIAPVDEQTPAHCQQPFAAPDLPWWKRRIEL